MRAGLGARHHEQRSRASIRPLRLLISALVILLVLPVDVASAYWSTGSAAGGSGAAAATIVERGATPTATVAGTAVTVDWEPTAVTGTQAATGYLVQRYDEATHTSQPVLSACGDRRSDTTCTERDVPAGSWRYSVTPLIGTSWAGEESALSPPAEVDPSHVGPALRSAASYSVLGGTGVTSTLATTVSGNLGLSTSGSIAGFPPGIVAGRIHDKTPDAVQAAVDLELAYTDAAARTFTTSFAGDQIGSTFGPGVHRTGAAFANSGTMTLDAGGDPHAIFVFQIDAAMNLAAASQVLLVDGARASNVFWQVNGAVAVGANAALSGTLLARGAITLGDGVVLLGRALAVGAVTMASNTIRFTAAPPPHVTIDGAGPGGSTDVTKDTTPTVSGTSDVGPGVTVTVEVAGQVLSTEVLGNGTWSLVTGELAAGDRTVVASVRDSSGNHGSATQLLTVEVNPAPVTLAGAAGYSVLGGTAVTSAGATRVSGDLGLSPSGAITGFPPGIVGGDVHDKESGAAQARSGLQAAYQDLDTRAAHREVVGDLGGQTFHAGIYHRSTALALTGTVTLDAEDDPSAVFVFQGDAALDTAASARVVLAGGARPGNVFWQVEGAVGIGAATSMAGTILAAGAITLGNGAEVLGRALTLAAVVMTAVTARFGAAVPATLTIDGDAPDGATARTSDDTPRLAGTTTAAPGRPVSVTVAGQTLSTTVAPDGTWATTAEALPPGTHPVVARVVDGDGNGTRATQALTVEVNPAPVSLGSAADYSVLSGTSIGNTGASTHLAGCAGVSPAGTITGLAAADVDGTIEVNTPHSAQALADAETARADLDARAPHQQFSGVLGGRVFRAGIHHATAALDLTGSVTLDGQGLPDQVFIFQGDAAMTTAALAQVTLVNGALARNVYFVVAGALSAGAGSTLRGSVVARGAVTLGAGTQLEGRVLARGPVTMSDTTVWGP